MEKSFVNKNHWEKSIGKMVPRGARKKILILAERASDAVNQERSARSAEEKFDGFMQWCGIIVAPPGELQQEPPKYPPG